MTLTPRNDLNQVIGAGLKVSADVGVSEPNNLGPLTDMGDGTYEVVYSIPTGASNATVSFTVNGVLLSLPSAQTAISWAP